MTPGRNHLRLDCRRARRIVSRNLLQVSLADMNLNEASFVVQLAKEAGLKVIASAGQESKLDFLRKIGADVVFNYKTTDLESVLKEHGPIDMCVYTIGSLSVDLSRLTPC